MHELWGLRARHTTTLFTSSPYALRFRLVLPLVYVHCVTHYMSYWCGQHAHACPNQQRHHECLRESGRPVQNAHLSVLPPSLLHPLLPPCLPSLRLLLRRASEKTHKHNCTREHPKQATVTASLRTHTFCSSSVAAPPSSACGPCIPFCGSFCGVHMKTRTHTIAQRNSQKERQ